MRSSYCGWRSWLAVLVILLSFAPTLSRAGEGASDTEIVMVSAEQFAPSQQPETDQGDGGFGVDQSDSGGGLAVEQKPVPKTLVELAAESPDAPAAKLVKANNAFAIKIYKQLVKEQEEQKESKNRKSFCFSPYSIATVLQAIKVGTRGETEEEFVKTMCLAISGDDLHQGYRTLLNIVNRFDTKSGFYDCPIEVKIANKFWFQQRQQAHVLPEFLQVISRYYDCGIGEVDFMDHEKAASQINDWIAKETKQYIKELIQPGDIEDPTFFVATNIIFFQGKWCAPFLPANTRTQPFYGSDGKTKIGQVSMMRSTLGNMNKVAKVDGISILQRPYYGRMSFVVLLPPTGKKELQKLEESLSVEKLAKWMAQVDYVTLKSLELPKFNIQSGYSLQETLEKLGLKKAFDRDAADFSGMISKKSKWYPIWAYKVLHKTMIEVDEAGTTAIAASCGMGRGGGSMELSNFIANRPFLFLILDDKTSSILFMGRYTGPDKK